MPNELPDPDASVSTFELELQDDDAGCIDTAPLT